MTIHLPEDAERSLLAVVQSGRYASLDDAMTDAVTLLVSRLSEEQAASPPGPQPDRPPAADKPLLEEILELTDDVPDAEWDSLPPDLAEQHDHYIYGTPKRPVR